jgi:iron complex outermembrane receptor protein
VVDPLTISVNAGYLNAKYTDYRQSGSAVLADFDLSGQQMPNSPKLQLSFNAALDQPLNDKLRLVGNALVTHTSRVIFLPSALPGVIPDAAGPGYWLVNARIGLRTADDKFGVALVADNLFNRAYYTSGASLAVGNSLTWGDRRIIRGEVTAKF